MSDPESRARSVGSSLGADDFLRGGCGCVLGAPERKGTSARESARCALGRAVFSHARSGWPRVVVCVSDVAIFQQLHELILVEEEFAKRLAQHWWTHVLSRDGVPGMKQHSGYVPGSPSATRAVIREDGRRSACEGILQQGNGQ